MGVAVDVVVAIVVLGALIAIYAVSARNTFERQAGITAESWRTLDGELDRRQETLAELLELLARRGSFRSNALAAVRAARCAAIEARAWGATAQGDAEWRLGDALGGLFAVTENDRALALDGDYRRLRALLGEEADHIAECRTGYNDKVAAYNARLDRFPSHLLADGRPRARPFAAEPPLRREPRWSGPCPDLG